ncbi:MAG: hypothetical protein Q9P01_05260 [Anaerolineae bacterium]|nr:hypothetical protein [Anaerolineae bacterium]
MKNICVIGSGYVGMVTATCFADLGNKIVAVDVDEGKIEKLKQGVMPIYEPGSRRIGGAQCQCQATHTSRLLMKRVCKMQILSSFVWVHRRQLMVKLILKYVRAAAQTIAEK